MTFIDYEVLFRKYCIGNAHFPFELIIPRIRPIPVENVSDKFKNQQFDKGYETLDFEIFLKCKMPTLSLFINTQNRLSIEAKLMDKYNDFSANFFERNSKLESLNLSELLYYQKEIDLRGRHPLNGNIEEPVLVVESEHKRILYNGYHRVAIALLLDKMSIQAYILPMD